MARVDMQRVVDAKGGGTRNKKQYSTQLIIRRRRSKRYGQLSK